MAIRSVFVMVLFLVANSASAQVIRAEYELVGVDSSGAEALVGYGVHYVAADGRYRHDWTEAGEELSLYRLPADGVSVSVNHRLKAAVPSPLNVPPWNPSTRRRFALPGVDLSSPSDRQPQAQGYRPTAMLGERAHGPMLLRGFRHVTASGTTESWWYYYPADPAGRRFVPVQMEETIEFADGGKSFLRLVSVGRIPLSPDLFTAPYAP